MRKLIAVLAAVSAFATAAGAATPLTLVQNEYAFARAVAAHGIHDGFLMYLYPEAVTFNPKPVNAYDLYKKQKPSATQLKWYPAFALVSASGDFGVDTGPWTAQWSEKGKAEYAYGEWLTIWHRGKSGAWQALFDGGVDNPAPVAPQAALAENGKTDQLPGPAKTVSLQETQGAVRKADAAFNDYAVDSGPRAAYQQYGAVNMRLLQPDLQPVVGRNAVLNATPEGKSALIWVPSGGSVSSAGDLAYLYGMTYMSDDTKHIKPEGVYVHVWQRDAAGWKLLISMQKPLPQPVVQPLKSN